MWGIKDRAGMVGTKVGGSLGTKQAVADHKKPRVSLRKMTLAAASWRLVLWPG